MDEEPHEFDHRLKGGVCVEIQHASRLRRVDSDRHRNAATAHNNGALAALGGHAEEMQQGCPAATGIADDAGGLQAKGVHQGQDLSGPQCAPGCCALRERGGLAGASKAGQVWRDAAEVATKP